LLYYYYSYIFFIFIILILIKIVIFSQKHLFDKVLNSAGKTSVKSMKVDVSDLEQYEEIYISALKNLKNESTVSKICI